MLKNSFSFWNFKTFMLFIFSALSFSSQALNEKTFDILSMIENEDYLSASHMLEKEISLSRDHDIKGSYALLLSQIPLNVPIKKARYKYSSMAARWAKSISPKKRMQLWIEAGDGSFKQGDLGEADEYYKQAFALADSQKIQMETAYVLYKRAWIKVNEKKWDQAFFFLKQALKDKKENRLRENILSIMGQFWVESQYSEDKISFKALEAGFQLVSLEHQKVIIEGILRGINRFKKKDMDKTVSLFSEDQKLSTQVLNHFFSKDSLMDIPACQFLDWIKTTKIEELNRSKTLSVLNTCTKSLLSKNIKKEEQKEKIEKIAKLYENFERKGIERWPLVRTYEYLGQKDKACSESFHQLAETAESPKDQNVKIQETLSETFRLCEDIKTAFPSSEELIKTLLSSKKVINNYQRVEGEWENILFQILDKEVFNPLVRKNILTFKKWKGKDLLPRLVSSHIQDYALEELKSFLSVFSPSNPVPSYYLDLFIAGDILTVAELQKRLPLSSVNSYRKTLPWLKKSISGKLNASQETIVMDKLLKYFPSKGKDRQEAALFLALHYLKTNQLDKIFKNWNMLSSAFNKKNLAMELFEKSLSESEKTCTSLKSFSLSEKKKSPLLKFMDQCCHTMSSKGIATLSNFELPPSLQSSALAKDFVFLARIQIRTLWVEKKISQLKDKTTKMIMDLKSVVTRYQKWEWRQEALALKSQASLQKQIDLFEIELTKLAVSSPHSEKYKELKKIVSQWR